MRASPGKTTLGQTRQFAGHQIKGRLRWWLIPRRPQIELYRA